MRNEAMLVTVVVVAILVLVALGAVAAVQDVTDGLAVATEAGGLHTLLVTLVMGRPDRAPEYDTGSRAASPGEVVAAPEVSDLEQAWGTDRGEWGLMGPAPYGDEPLAFVRRFDTMPRRSVYYTLERTAEDGVRYVALEKRFTLDAIAEVVREHHTGEPAAAELDAIERVGDG